PHSVWVDREERVFIVDRENHRIQIFDSDGRYLTEWTGFVRPQDIFIDADDTVYVAEARPSVSILTLEGELLARVGEAGDAPGQFQGYPHAVWVDSHGDLYVGEVPSQGLFQKFARA
ncbi:MAG: peptidyl-alpha-hydroxyglycine alpha-amidating lyase family protein, partial [Vicinamibacterales bacterium]